MNPAPTVDWLSRKIKCNPTFKGQYSIKETLKTKESPGITIDTESSKIIVPVILAVLKKNWGFKWVGKGGFFSPFFFDKKQTFGGKGFLAFINPGAV